MPIFYHGTIKEYLPEIIKSGIIETTVGTYDDQGVFLTNTPRSALMWARSHCSNTFQESEQLRKKYKNCTPIVLRIRVPKNKISKLAPDWNRLTDIEESEDEDIDPNISWQESLKMVHELKYIDPIPIIWVDRMCQDEQCHKWTNINRIAI